MTSKARTDQVRTLEEALSPPLDGADMRITSVLLTPEEAHTILSIMSYPKQRRIMRGHVGMLADAMVNGDFVRGRQITFAPNYDGKQELIDGQHRLQAAVDANWTGKWSICCLWDKDDYADRAYIRLDTAQKERTAAVIGRAAGYENLTAGMQSCIIAAARYQNVWSDEYELPSFCNTPPPRDCLARVDDHMEAFATANAMLLDSRVRPQIKRRIISPMVMAVISETLHTAPSEAKEFWYKVATNGDEVSGDLRNLLIVGKPKKGSIYYMPRITTQAWNQREAKKMRYKKKDPIQLNQSSLVVPE